MSNFCARKLYEKVVHTMSYTHLLVQIENVQEIDPGNVLSPSSWYYRCGYQQQPATIHSVVIFECPPPGLKGNTISVQQNAQDRIYVVEIEVLGKLIM